MNYGSKVHIFHIRKGNDVCWSSTNGSEHGAFQERKLTIITKLNLMRLQVPARDTASFLSARLTSNFKNLPGENCNESTDTYRERLYHP